MKKVIISSFMILVVAGLIMIPVTATSMSQNSKDFTRVVIGLESSDSKESVVNIVQNYNGALIKEIKQINVLVFKIPTSAFDKLKSDPVLSKSIKYLEEDKIIRIPESDVKILNDDTIKVTSGMQSTPNDTLFSNQWGMQMIGAPYAWNVTTGNPSVIVAVVDTGVDYTHEDLSANVNASLGWDFVNNDANTMDDNGHGTHVAGIVAAEMNNNKGVVGVAPNVTVMPVKVLDAKGSGYSSDVADGIVWAVDHGAKIVSLSLGGGPAYVLENATQYAVFDKGALCIAAAGNDGNSNPNYPAAYKWVIGVSAVCPDGNITYYSNYGDFVYLAAPGGSGFGGSNDILSTYLGNKYVYMAGTSMATPHVSGVAALFWSYNTSFTNKQIARFLISNADDKGSPGRDPYYGFGLVDAWPPDG
ncbi:MAG TPA: peptidase S8 [Methanosarcinales archaeon]|nr:peptidase S8 [Methanosarcinales archaeon]